MASTQSKFGVWFVVAGYALTVIVSLTLVGVRLLTSAAVPDWTLGLLGVVAGTGMLLAWLLG